MVVVVIVGFNSKKDLRGCLDSLFKSKGIKLRVIFVDNSSSDGSADFVRKNYPQVQVIENQNNGYAGGNNKGIHQALKYKCKYIFLLNPDTIVNSKCLQLLVNSADQNTIIQPLILLHKNNRKTSLVNTSGSYLNFLGFSYCSNYLARKKSIKDKKISTASGAAVLVPVSLVKKNGLLNENYFMYFEDTDWFWRARMAGYKISLLTDAVVWHKYSFSKNSMKMYYSERNRLLFLYQNFTMRYLWLIMPIFIFNELSIVIYSIFNGWFQWKILSYFSFVKLVCSKKIKKNVRFSFNTLQKQTILQYIGHKIQFSEFHSILFKPYNVILKLYWNLIKSLI